MVGSADLLLRELPEGDPDAADVLEMHKAGRAGSTCFPRYLSTRIQVTRDG